jgi:hypothetical protein
MASKEDSITWLQRRMAEYRAGRTGMSKVVEDLDEVGKLGQRFTLVDELEEIDLSKGDVSRSTYINKNPPGECKRLVSELLREFNDCFT